MQSKSFTATGSPANMPTGLAGLAAAIDFFGLGQGRGRIDPQERPHRAVVPLDAVQAGPGEFRRANLAGGQLANQCCGGKAEHGEKGQGSGFGGQGSGVRVRGSGFGIRGSGFGIRGSGVRIMK